MNTYHAHDILNLLIESQQPYTIETLKKEIANSYGADATFCTCKLKDLTIARIFCC